MSKCKLLVHQKTYAKDNEILLSQKDFPAFKISDVIEIYSPEDDYSRLLLQVKAFSDPNKETPRSAISIEQTIANIFRLRPYGDVIVNVVNPEEVALDSVELVFKDQYLARSDMWMLRRHMMNSCVHINKKIEFSGIRCQVFEMWLQGERVACGYINEDTKIVYRSASSMVYLFIQMSSEMWDFDINGDLYFEKAVNGFLFDLFNKWKKFNCSHDVTIVLFSRTFYEASSIDEFPDYMKDCLQQDYKGRYYEDFYRVAVQNERYEDWRPTLVLLKQLFNQYENEVLRFHERQSGVRIPRAYNSTSSQGNFLEVLNMSLNVFVEKHHLDRSFDRTGQLSVVISPGVGVFEVDLDLTNTTKQRIIDNGIGSDLVCLGEQPLHAVPLFKFNARVDYAHSITVNDFQYNMPHWINLSFYSSPIKSSYSHFVPRIKCPNFMPKQETASRQASHVQLYRSSSRDSTSSKTCRNIPTLIDYDEYDAQIFKIPTTVSLINNNNSMRRKSTLSPKITQQFEYSQRLQRLKRRSSETRDTLFAEFDSIFKDLSFKESLPVQVPTTELQLNPRFQVLSTSVENKIDSKYQIASSFKQKPHSKDDLIVRGYNSNFIGSTLKSKALINPFDPSHVTIKLTSNRRRWTHVFPLGPTGIFMQQHHYQAVPQNTASTLLPSSACADTTLTSPSTLDKRDQVDGAPRKISVVQMRTDNPWANEHRKSTSKNPNIENIKISKCGPMRSPSAIAGGLDANKPAVSDKSLLWAWGATGEQEWTPAITTGVDWKSLVMPACLPISTDFLPDKRTLQQDYVTYAYTLLPEDQSAELLQQHCYRGEEDIKNHTPLTTKQVYLELICQRLQQGFQIILFPKSESLQISRPANLVIADNRGNSSDKEEYAMSIGRIYHELKLEERSIIITNYHPRHPYPVIKIHYCYRFRAPDNETYGISWVDFTSEKLENYNWNYLDNYICMRGDSEYELRENLKFWRFRLLMLPTMQATRIIIEKYLSGEEEGFACDLYFDFTQNEKNQLQEGFLRFLDIINRIRRFAPVQTKKQIRTEIQTGNRRSSLSVGKDKNDNETLSKERAQTTTTKHEKYTSRAKTQPIILEKSGDEPDGNCSTKVMMIDQENLLQYESQNEVKKLTLKTAHNILLESMKNSKSINFLMRQGGLPPFSFISFEAVSWAKDNIVDIFDERDAILLFQTMCQAGLISHASGDKKRPFKYGYYFYYIVDQNQTEVTIPDVEMFEKEWMEVGIIPQSLINDENEPENCDLETFSSDDQAIEKGFTFKKMMLYSDAKSSRIEWVDVKYHSLYDPEHAFELVIEWMVSTGNAISEIVQVWSRKAANTGMHLVPIPADPFALPFSSKSDPLRGPIFIPLNIECLPRLAVKMLKDEGMFNFQERILVKFGFIPFLDPQTDNQRQFVHVSGSIFVMLPSKNPSNKKFRKRGKLIKKREDTDTCSPHEEYITRHFSGVKQSGELTKIDVKIGFIWCWNYMITKRWKTGVTGDENSMRKIMEDFRRFCKNTNDRLINFWETYEMTL